MILAKQLRDRYKHLLSKFVGRDATERDQPAFDRISEAFKPSGEAKTGKPVAPVGRQIIE